MGAEKNETGSIKPSQGRTRRLNVFVFTFLLPLPNAFVTVEMSCQILGFYCFGLEITAFD